MLRKAKKNKAHTKRAAAVAVLSITLALIIILQLFASLLQKLGMPMSLALGLIPVFVISQTHGWKFGAISGTFFGLITLVFSVIYASAIPIYAVTVNPLVSVFPRIAAGIIPALTYDGIMRIVSKHSLSLRKRRITSIGVSALSTALGVLTNTLLFLGMFFAFAHGKTYDNVTIDLRWVLTSIVALNTVIELVLFTVVTPPIVYAMTQSKLAAKIRLTAETENEEYREEDIENEQSYDKKDTENDNTSDEIEPETEKFYNDNKPVNEKHDENIGKSNSDGLNDDK